ncbi:Uncharacterised protein [Mycobacteroides abscessus subsp. massiliense]|nr:Uncharacterised protein [Mycobacteroides abscessus subsp. massiliense]
MGKCHAGQSTCDGQTGCDHHRRYAPIAGAEGVVDTEAGTAALLVAADEEDGVVRAGTQRQRAHQGVGHHRGRNEPCQRQEAGHRGCDPDRDAHRDQWQKGDHQRAVDQQQQATHQHHRQTADDHDIAHHGVDLIGGGLAGSGGIDRGAGRLGDVIDDALHGFCRFHRLGTADFPG